MSSKSISTAVVLSLLFGSAVLGMPASDVTKTPATGSKTDLSKPMDSSSSSNLQVPGSAGLSSQTPAKVQDNLTPKPLSASPKSSTVTKPKLPGVGKKHKKPARLQPGGKRKPRHPQHRHRPGHSSLRKKPTRGKNPKKLNDNDADDKPSKLSDKTKPKRKGKNTKPTDNDADDKPSKLSGKTKASDTKLPGASSPLSKSGKPGPSSDTDAKPQGPSSPLPKSGKLSTSSQTPTNLVKRAAGNSGSTKPKRSKKRKSKTLKMKPAQAEEEEDEK